MPPQSTPQSSILVFDGGMGTELYERGFFINRPFEELNLSSPADVANVHLAYIEAGAQVLTTNTFGASRPQLKEFDIDQKLFEIIQAALKNANHARKGHDKVQVALSMGPLGVLVEPLGPFALSDAKEEFRLIASSACQSGQDFDLYILETFTQIAELEVAIEGIRKVDPVRPIVASLSVKSSQKDLLTEFAKRIGERTDIQYLGLNCSEGPSDLYVSLKFLKPLTQKPLIIQPNAGTPRHVNGRYFYMSSPDYVAKFAKRFAEAGAAGVGGCCGTRPEHIHAIAHSLKMVDAQIYGGIAGMNRTKKQDAGAVKGGTTPGTSESQPRRSLADRKESKIGQILNAGKKVLSVEVLPPKGTDLVKFFEGIELLQKTGVDLINIPDGARAMTRVNSMHLASLVQSRTKGAMHAIPHFTTRDRNLIALQSDLLGAYVNGVTDVLIVTGDPPKLGNNREATAVYDIDSIGLTYLADCLNRGITPSGESIGRGTSFGIGVATNPTAINLELEHQRYLYKLESGADFAITQPIFDSESFLRWMDRLGDKAIPHVVGIWPLISLRNAEFMANEVPGLHVPTWVLKEMEKSADANGSTDSPEAKADAIKRGIDIALKVMEEIRSVASGVCISAPLGRVDIVSKLIGAHSK
ncbi:MAG: bifunctional homocysteine S-methyltransferase/methylenetetrahydrofolate reductase [Bdellovibrionales bacterium]|nr:bifunctional homocysteine S-methyltransferase/methylenetetrahydrofolate reductase [Bdellovibrionales bacterium]